MIFYNVLNRLEKLSLLLFSVATHSFPNPLGVNKKLFLSKKDKSGKSYIKISVIILIFTALFFALTYTFY
jgi:hypothetical protein